MDVHKNARLTPRGREEMVLVVVEQGLTTAQAARRFFTSAKTVKKWVERYQELGVAGLRDRSSRPHSSPRRTPPATCLAAETLRRQRHTQSHFATALSLSLATGSRLMAARGLSRLAAIQPGEPRPCYERKAPGELSHIDIKKLGKFWKTGFRITGRKPATSAATAPATSLLTSPSTITRASHASICCPTSEKRAPSSA